MPTRKKKPAAAPPLPTHSEGLALFQAVLARLVDGGWRQERVDTLTHPAAIEQAESIRAARTVRHHFSAHTWELWYEIDRRFRPVDPTSRCVKIRLDRPLPTVEDVINGLFGNETGYYFPLKQGALRVETHLVDHYPTKESIA